MLSEEQKRIALKKNIEYIRENTRRFRDDGGEEVTLTWYADEDSFHRMRTSQEGDDYEYRQLIVKEAAKIILSFGLSLKVQILDADNYFKWLGDRENTLKSQEEYSDGTLLSGDEAKALLGIK
jgi:hypothetical protein